MGILGVLLAASPMRTASTQNGAHAISASEMQELVKLDTLWLSFFRQRNARDYAITTPNGIQEDRYIRLGGIEQWISIRGEDRNNPVLLLVHGGPGDATSLYGWALLRSWFKRYTVVQWDQRGAGRTRPDFFYAFVGSGQIGAPSDETLAVAYRLVLAAANQRGERVAVRELTAIGPPPWRDGRAYAVEHKWTNLLEHNDTFINATLAFELTAPNASIADLNASIDGELFSGDQLAPHLAEIDPALFRGTFSVPIFVIQGADDLTSPPSLARAFVRAIRAPQKDFLTLPAAGHFALFTRPDAFLNALTGVVAFAR